MWHKIALIMLYFVGVIFFLFVTLIVASKIWKRYKKSKKTLLEISKVTGATVKGFHGKGFFRRVPYKFLLPDFNNKSIILKVEATSPIKLVIIKKRFEVPIVPTLKRVYLKNIDIDNEYLIYSSDVSEAQKWLNNFIIYDELKRVLNSGCYKIVLKKGYFKAYWSRLTQLELKYLPDWIAETINGFVVLREVIANGMKRKAVKNPLTLLHFIVFVLIFMIFATLYSITKPLDFKEILITSTIFALPVMHYHIYKIIYTTFKPKLNYLIPSYIFISLSSIMVMFSIIVSIDGLFLSDKKGEYAKIKSFKSFHLSKNVCLELIEFKESKYLLNPTVICSQSKENIEATIYKGRFYYNFVSIKKRVVKLSLVDVYIALENGDINQALELSNRFITLNPDSIDGYYTRSKIKFKLKKYSEAFRDMEKILDIDSHYLNGYLFIDKILSKSERWNQIIEYWTKFIKLEPSNPIGYKERAETYLKIGKKDLAKKDFERACNLGLEKACIEKKKLK